MARIRASYPGLMLMVSLGFYRNARVYRGRPSGRLAPGSCCCFTRYMKLKAGTPQTQRGKSEKQKPRVSGVDGAALSASFLWTVGCSVGCQHPATACMHKATRTCRKGTFSRKQKMKMCTHNSYLPTMVVLVKEIAPIFAA